MEQKNSQHAELIKKLYNEVWTNANLTCLEELFTSDVKYSDPAVPNMKKGLQGVKELETMYKSAFPTKNTKIEHMWHTNDGCIITHWSVHGTHKGTFHDIPPTGKHFNITGISIYKFAGNKICEVTQIWNLYGLLEQLGLSMHAGSLR